MPKLIAAPLCPTFASLSQRNPAPLFIRNRKPLQQRKPTTIQRGMETDSQPSAGISEGRTLWGTFRAILYVYAPVENYVIF